MWRKMPPGELSQNCRYESQGGFAKGRRLGDSKRGAWIPIVWAKAFWYIPYPGTNLAKFIPILGSSGPGPGSLAPL